jgi:plastocyanin
MRKIPLVVAVLVLVAAACGGDDGGEATGATNATGETSTGSTATGATATGATATGGTATGPTSTGGDCPDLTGEGDIFTIRISGFDFVPDCFTASASQGIEIVNEDQVPHTFTIPDTEVNAPVGPGATFEGEPITGLVEPGTYDVVCTIHPAMTGSVTIVA